MVNERKILSIQKNVFPLFEKAKILHAAVFTRFRRREKGLKRNCKKINIFKKIDHFVGHIVFFLSILKSKKKMAVGIWTTS